MNAITRAYVHGHGRNGQSSVIIDTAKTLQTVCINARNAEIYLLISVSNSDSANQINEL